jgi:predicted N-formylglutamate amidohydrolase
MDSKTADICSGDAVETVNGDAATPLLLICDHAGNKVPAQFIDATGPLGLTPAQMAQHVAWDIGAAAVTRMLADRLCAAAVLSVYSRLLLDPNRSLGDPDSIPAVSDGIAIPANVNLTACDRTARARTLFWPYHQAVDEQLARLMRGGRVPLLLSMHSFTPQLASTGQPRPWHVGVMCSRDTRLSDALVSALRARGDLVVGVNEPYSGITHGYCLKLHGLSQGIPHAQIEVRQDLIESDTGQQQWADLLAEVLRPILADDALHAIVHD